ncbi:MAG: WYL domain-containing protein [Bacteroidales bacterium]|jgi:predicted DNA-binding transcriptional regulator YafY|nr:WYL domain-containing protein [Bacteroidales bacterium]
MAYLDFKRYVWLIDLLNNVDGATFSEIDDAWQDEPVLNPQGAKFPRRTFHNHLAAIEHVFGVVIKRIDGKYRIAEEDLYAKRMQKTLMSLLSIQNTIDRSKDLKGRILFEDDPNVSPELTRRIIHAMNNRRKVRLKYQKFGEKRVTTRLVSPYCLKMFKHRWYLLAKEGATLKVFALDSRMQDVDETREAFDLPADFDAKGYFHDAFGIRTGKPKLVHVKTYGQETDYWRSAPLHHSQREVRTTDNFSIFSLKVNIDAWELIQELLSRGGSIEILKPDSLRKEMALQIASMRERYAELKDLDKAPRVM